MAFASYSFLIFLAALLVVYYTVPGRVQWVLLLSGSLLFYLGSGWQNLVYMLLTAASTYAATRLMERNQRAFTFIITDCTIKQE